METPAREDHLTALYRDFPNIPKAWVEMAYDVIQKMDPEEVEKMKARVEVKDLKPKERDAPGEVQGVEILSAP